MLLSILTCLAYSGAFNLQLKCLEQLTVLVWYVWLGEHCLVLISGIFSCWQSSLLWRLEDPWNCFVVFLWVTVKQKLFKKWRWFCVSHCCSSCLRESSAQNWALVPPRQVQLEVWGSSLERLQSSHWTATDNWLQVSDCKCSWFLPCQKNPQKTKKIPEEPKFRRNWGLRHFSAVRRPLYLSLLAVSSSLHSIAWVTFQCPYGAGHPGTIDQRDEGPRPMGLKRSVCL